MNNADSIVRVLRDAGVTHAFGVPAGNVLPLIEAARQGGIQFVLMAHEGSAAFAAEVTGRLTGRPGFCLSTMGPGATNLTTGVGCAYLDRSPLVAITCNVPTHQLGRRVQMVIDHNALFRPITKSTCPLRGDAAASLAGAVQLALSEPPGPVHLDLPEDVAAADTSTLPAFSLEPTRLPAAPDADVAAVARLLGAARRPVAVIGASARRLRNPALLRAFVERHALPFATTTMAKGMIDEDHALSLGCIERARRQVQRQFLRSADLVVGVGYDVAEVEYEQWIGGVPLVSVDIEAVDADPSVNVLHQAIGDLDESLARLVAAPAAEGARWEDGEVAAHRERFHASLRPAGWSFAPWQAIDVARAVLPRDGIIAFDVGAHTHQIASQWRAHAPGQFLVTNSWSSMGFGIPAAIAAKLARPDAPVLCIVGDGGFQMTCGEVAVAQRLGLSIPIVVFDDGWLSLIQVKQLKRHMPLHGTQLRRAPAPAGRSHYFGAPAVGVRTPEEFEAALRAALRADGPTVIEAAVEGAQYEQTVYD